VDKEGVMSGYFWMICAYVSLTGFWIVEEATGPLIFSAIWAAVMATWRIWRDTKDA